jgi:predicted dehydrogenase
MSRLRLAVIGAGVMGRRHLAAARSSPDIALVAAVDRDRTCADEAAKIAGCTAATTTDGLEGRIDAAVIAAPTAAHAGLAVPLLRSGISCLVEKPLAGSEAEILRMIGAAREGRAVLQVGHVERFNPAVETLLAGASGTDAIRALAARRMSAASARVIDIDVVTDLMVHDLDVVLALKPAEIAAVQTAGNDDHAVALLRFADGAVATLTASRLTATRVRDLDVADEDAFFHLDYIGRTVTRTLRRGADHMASTQLAVPESDALAAQLADFVRCVRTQAKPRVSGEDALAVMRIAWRIQAALQA